MTLARYTPAEARALEDHYIACAKAEGIWDAGIPPRSGREGPTTAAGFKRCNDAEARRMYILSLIQAGYDNVTSIKSKTRSHDSTVRKFFRILNEQGHIELIRIGPMGEKIWRAKNTVTGR